MLRSFQILGYSGGMPFSGRDVSSVILSSHNYEIMIDCGENAFNSYIKNGYRLEKLKYIFITHMHPDHTGGLTNLLFYRKIMKVKTDLVIWGPPEIPKYLKQCFKYQKINLNFKLEVNLIQDKEIIINDDIMINSMMMDHSIECWGYSFHDKINKFVFITDTRPNDNSIILAKDADLLIHESTYTDNHIDIAHKLFHTTISQAKEIATKANVKRLILTHFSTQIRKKELNNIFYNSKDCIIYNEKYYFNVNEN